MNILVDQAPKTVSIDGAEVPINSDFRASIRFEILMEDADFSEEEKVYRSLEIYYPKIPRNTLNAIDKLLWFYRAGKEVCENGPESSKKVSQIYSYNYDDEYIYSAFLGQYGVDLQDIPYLHWWKFKAMFLGLKPDTRFVEIMGYREIEITPQMSKDQKQFYRKMKKQFSLPLPKSEQEKHSAIEEALLNGGNLSKLL